MKTRSLFLVMSLSLLLTLASCSGPVAEDPEDPAVKMADTDKIPITTTSEDARALFLQGRELAEKIRAAEARELFQEAVAADPGFALAHLALANTAPTNQEFFQSLERAVALASQVSDGERLMILGLDAGVRSDPHAQLDFYEELVTSFPEDERAHNLLGGLHFGRQEYEEAIPHFERATAIAPDYSPVYNSLGYSYRFLGNYDAAERAFQKYVELLPDEPNPYDSYAELLMKMGRYDESIENYQKALERSPEFVLSYIGIGNNRIFQGQHDEAREAFQKLFDGARNDGERRQAIFWTAASFLYQGDTGKALEEVEKMAKIAETSGDLSALSGDENLMGDILRHAGRLDDASAMYDRSVETMERADVRAEVKDTARRNMIFDAARIALANDDLSTARSMAQEYREQAEAKGVPGEIRRANELDGMISLDEGDAEIALGVLEGATQQNPQVLYLMALASHQKGDDERALELADEAANFNELNINYAYVRDKAQALLEKLQG